MSCVHSVRLSAWCAPVSMVCACVRLLLSVHSAKTVPTVWAFIDAAVNPRIHACSPFKGGALIERASGVVWCLVAQARGRERCSQCVDGHVSCHPGIVVSGWGASYSVQMQRTTLLPEPISFPTPHSKTLLAMQGTQ